ncbi:MAG: CapA family protein [Acutalibacteraceae bacterium]|nr:CapA family protein [Acutalibacteraceae bacterium]
MKILFTGDVNFRLFENFTKETSEDILSDILPYFNNSDFRIVNLECPLADIKKHKPIQKAGPNLICSPENIVFLNTANIDAVTLANNHIGDFGENAVKDTLDLLDENNILHSGAGKNIEYAYEPLRIEKDGISVSVISVCENEFGIAGEAEYGSAGYNPRFLLNRIRKEKAFGHKVVVVFHGGNEHNPLPSPDTVDRYRFICDMGADALIATHTHCPQGYEIYNGKPIVYSMGNFIFQSDIKRKSRDSWFYGYISILNITDKVSLEIIPYKFNTEKTKITVFDGDDKIKMMSYIDELSKIIQNQKELELYFSGWSWLHQWYPRIGGGFGDYNLVSCEAHNSQLKSIAKIYAYEKTDDIEYWSKKIKELQNMPV